MCKVRNTTNKTIFDTETTPTTTLKIQIDDKNIEKTVSLDHHRQKDKERTNDKHEIEEVRPKMQQTQNRKEWRKSQVQKK